MLKVFHLADLLWSGSRDDFDSAISVYPGSNMLALTEFDILAHFK